MTKGEIFSNYIECGKSFAIKLNMWGRAGKKGKKLREELLAMDAAAAAAEDAAKLRLNPIQSD